MKKIECHTDGAGWQSHQGAFLNLCEYPSFSDDHTSSTSKVNTRIRSYKSGRSNITHPLILPRYMQNFQMHCISENEVLEPLLQKYIVTMTWVMTLTATEHTADVSGQLNVNN